MSRRIYLPAEIIAAVEDGKIAKGALARQYGVTRQRINQLVAADWRRRHFKAACEEESKLPVRDRSIYFVPFSYHLRSALTSVSVAMKEPSWRQPTPPPTPEIETVADLLEWTVADLLKLYNFGRKSLDELQRFLDSEGLHLKPLPPQPSWITSYEFVTCAYCQGTGQRRIRHHQRTDLATNGVLSEGDGPA